jgi:hypothetical protein
MQNNECIPLTWKNLSNHSDWGIIFSCWNKNSLNYNWPLIQENFRWNSSHIKSKAS